MRTSNSAAMIYAALLFWKGRRSRDSDCSLQHGKKLLKPRFFLLGQFTLATEESGIKLGRKERVLETLEHPIDDRDHHLDVEIIAKLAALQAEAHEIYCAVRVFADQKAVDLALEDQVGAIVPQQ